MTTGYNDADQPTTTTTSTNPAGQGYTTTNVYDSISGALIGLSNTGNATANVALLTFTPRAQITTVTYLTTASTGLSSEQYTYDANLRATGASATWLSGSGTSGTILSQSRTYDPASNVTSLSTTLAAVPGVSGSGGSETQNFCYNEQNRLVWAGNSGSQPLPGNGTCGAGTLANTLQNAGYGTSYVYTHLGQLWQGPQGDTNTPSQYLYCDSSHPHQLTGLYSLGATCSNKTGQTYASSYDAWGNVTSRTVGSISATLSYDGLDHLTKYDAGSNGQEQYIYDASGERVLRRSTRAGSTSMTVYAFGLEEHRYSGSGVHQVVGGDTYYYSLGGMLVGESDGTNINMFLTDALGSVIETISATANSAAVQGNQVYSPYGSSRYQQGSMGTTKGFTGQYNDSVTGLDYYGARYYDPVVGRFLSADAVEGNGVGMDPYAYVDGNPETYSDPSGQFYVNNRLMAGGIVGSAGVASVVLTWVVCHTIVSCTAANTGTGSTPVNTTPLSDVIVTHGNATYTYDPQTGAITIETTFPDGRKVWQGMLPGDTGYEQALHAFDIQLPRAVNSAAWAAVRKHSDGGNNPPGGGDGGCSFTATTQVSTDQGKQAIGTLHVGDQVLAYNPKTHKMELEPVLHVWINHDHDLVDLTITKTAKGQHGKGATKTSEVVHTTSEHPFFTAEQGFVAAGNLKLGMHVLRADGNVGVVTGWKVVPGTEVMYNLEVAQDHTFTVGVGQWVVHNRCNPENLSNQNARRIAQRVLNAFNDHFKVSDLSGAWGDLHGNPVPDSAGGFYNHLLEVRNSLQSGRNAINAFVRLLNDPSLSEEDYCIIECLVGRISKTLDYVDKVINRDQWFEGANVLPFP